MGLSTLAGHRVTSARACIPAWGAWHADAEVDGDVSLSGRVELKIADLTLSGTVLSGGANNGRSRFHLVAGAGGWSRTIKRESYTTDSGVRLEKVIGDAASIVGETIDVGSRLGERIGSSFIRREDSASQVLNELAPRAWYVDEAGVTKLGRRAASPLSVRATRSDVDLANGTMTLAAESVATILPGVTVDGVEAIDVEHEVTPSGLRSMIWGPRGTSRARRLGAYQRLVKGLLPDLPFRGLYKYRVVTREGKRLNLQPVRVSTGMPDIKRARVMPGVAGCDASVKLGARVVVAFLDASPTEPVVVAFEDAEGEGFIPDTLRLQAGGMVAGEHVMTVEAASLLIYNTLVALMAAAGGGPLIAAVLQPLIGAAITTALTAQSVPAPPELAAQEALAAAQLPGFATGVVPATTSAFFSAAIAALATKTPNLSGKFPSTGSKSVEAG